MSQNFVISYFTVILLWLQRNDIIAGGYQGDTHHVAKRMELESCIGKHIKYNLSI